MNDLSFIRLEPNFDDAKYTRTSSMASIFFLNQIILSPNEFYLQTTNTKLGIAFDGNYQVKVVDCNYNELLDITENVAINERTINGLPQIDFEIAYIGQDFYNRKVYLKFIHTVSNYVWWSNPLVITDYYKFQSSRFEYKNVGDAFYQSIRLNTFFSINDAESQSSEYVTYEGKKVTSRLINTEFENYIFEKIDNFTYRRLNNLLSRNVVYVNSYRITDKQTIGAKDRISDTNISNIDFKVAIDYNESITQSLQLFENLELTSYEPSGIVSITPTEIKGTYNYNLTQQIGTIELYKGVTLLATFNETDIAIVGNEFSVDISALSITLDTYTVKLSNGLFSTLVGLTPYFEWQFELSGGEFDNTEFSNEFLIN
jgi:hypothetical protein